MADLKQYMITDPTDRKERIERLVTKFADDPTFKNWGVTLDQKMLEIQATKLAPPMILDGNRTSDYDSYLNRRVKNAEPLILRSGEWAMVYHEYDYDIVNDAIAMM
jgi:hypothetical protein